MALEANTLPLPPAMQEAGPWSGFAGSVTVGHDRRLEVESR
jgi:hypothetical protein